MEHRCAASLPLYCCCAHWDEISACCFSVVNENSSSLFTHAVADMFSLCIHILLWVFLLLQETWAKEFVACASLVSNVGERAVEALKKLEEHGVHLTGGMLRRCFEGLSVPEDQQELFRRYEEKSGKTTAAMFTEMCATIKLDRMWKWLVNHPDLGDDRVHPSRRVSKFPLLPCACLMAWFFLLADHVCRVPNLIVCFMLLCIIKRNCVFLSGSQALMRR